MFKITVNQPRSRIKFMEMRSKSILPALSQKRKRVLVLVFGLLITSGLHADTSGVGLESFWNSPSRMERVVAIAPGSPQPVPKQIYTPEYLKELQTTATQEEIAKWRQIADPLLAISDAKWREMIPEYSTYPSFDKGFTCPYCGVELGQMDPTGPNIFDIRKPYQAIRRCCDAVIYERAEDAPADYQYKPNKVMQVPHLDGKLHEYPYWEGKNRLGEATIVFARSAVWKTRLQYIRENALDALFNAWLKTGDEKYARKGLVILGRLAEVYPNWPLWSYAFGGRIDYKWWQEQVDGKLDVVKKGGLANDANGKPLTREVFEAQPRPNWFGNAPWGQANRLGLNSLGFYLRGLPAYYLAFKASPEVKNYSKELYGDTDRLESLIEENLIRELAKEFVSSRPVLGNYAQSTMSVAVYLGVAAQDSALYNFGLEQADYLPLNHGFPDVSFIEGSVGYCRMMGWLHVNAHNMLGAAAGQREKAFPFAKFAFENVNRIHTHMSTFRGVESGHGDGNDSDLVTGDRPYDPADQTRPVSRFLPHYGFATLSSGSPGNRIESLFLFDKNFFHNHMGNLNLQLAWEGALVAPELGYCSWWRPVDVSNRNPLYDAIHAIPWRYRLLDNMIDGFNMASENVWSLSHCGATQNIVLVNERAGRARYGFVKNGYAQALTLSAPPVHGVGSILQVAEAEDLTSWPFAGVNVSMYRRAILNIERPDGRAYVADLFRVTGGERHCYQFKVPRADIVESDLKNGTDAGNGQDHLDTFPGVKDWQGTYAQYPELGNTSDSGFRFLKDVKAFKTPDRNWHVRWLWDNRLRNDVEKTQFPKVNVDMRGVEIDSNSKLVQEEIWFSKSNYAMQLIETVEGKKQAGAVAFENGISIYTSFRQGKPGLISRFAHLFELYPEGQSAIISKTSSLPLPKTKLLSYGIRDQYGIGVETTFVGGGRDILVSAADNETRRFSDRADGLQTSARFALVRLDASGLFQEGALVDGRGFAIGNVAVESTGSLSGTIIDIRGDITGTRLESALIIRPSTPWPVGQCLTNERIFIEVLPDKYDAYTVGQVSRLGDLIRVDLEGIPSLAYHWDRVKEIKAERPDVIEVMTQALQKSSQNDYFQGKHILFPTRGLDLSIAEIAPGRDHGLSRIVVGGGVDLRTAGVRAGDPLLVYGMAVGQTVHIPSRIAVRKQQDNRYVVQANVNFTLRDGARSAAVKAEELGTGEATIEL